MPSDEPIRLGGEPGALLPSACPSRDGMFRCRCGKCSVCRFPKHTAIHGPRQGEPAGSEPWGHQFIPVKCFEVER